MEKMPKLLFLEGKELLRVSTSNRCAGGGGATGGDSATSGAVFSGKSSVVVAEGEGRKTIATTTEAAACSGGAGRSCRCVSIKRSSEGGIGAVAVVVLFFLFSVVFIIEMDGILEPHGIVG